MKTAAAISVVFLAVTMRGQVSQDFTKVEIRTTRISSNLYALEGQGGTIGVLAGPDGVFMVDTQFAPLSDKIAAAIRKITDRPVRFIVNTHVHPDHTGGNENFAKMGAVILSRDELRDRLAHPAPGPNGAPGTPAPAAALPMITYRGSVTFHMNGEDVELIPIRLAHTDGDTLVRFVANDVMMSGDFFRPVEYPNIDRANGGTLDGMLDGLAVLIGSAGPETKIIPGHGPIVNRSAVVKHRDMILAIRDRVAPLVQQGKTLEEVIASKPTADFDAMLQQPGERFVVQLYAELKTK